MNHVLKVKGLSIHAGEQRLVHDVDLTLRSGELVAIVGESGAGKSLTGRALVGMVPFSPGIVEGTVTWTRPDAPPVVIPAKPSDARRQGLDRIRGQGVAWIPQDAQAALVPVQSVHRQLGDALRHVGRDPSRDTCIQLLQAVGFTDPASILLHYPHTLSGGMARRVQVALGLALGAPFLMADEPTTGLDHPVQARLLQTLARIRDSGIGIALITHDLHLVRRHADRILVMDAGRIVARGPPALLDHHTHPALVRLRGGA